MEENKDLFRKVLSKDEFYLSNYHSDNNGGYLYTGYYQRVSFTNNTHLWYFKDESKKEKFDIISDKARIETLDNLYFKAVDESSF